jgi:hypothetical protein
MLIDDFPCVTLVHPQCRSTLNRVHDAAELGEDAVAGSVDDAPAVFANHRKNNALMGFEIGDRPRLIGAHKGAVADNIGGQDGSQSAIELVSVSLVHREKFVQKRRTRVAQPSW